MHDAQCGRVDLRLTSCLAAHGGVATREQLLAAAPRHLLDSAVSGGGLRRVLPRVYVGAGRNAPMIRAALAFAGPGAALSHTTALQRWGLSVPDTGPIHVTTPRDRDRRSTAAVMVHRHGAAALPDHLIRLRDGLPTLDVATSLVDSWSFLPAQLRRAPVITAVRDQLTSATVLQEITTPRARLRGRAELLLLLSLLAEGCHSELEIWGHRQVFSHRLLPPSERQVQVRTGAGRFLLDVAWPELRLGVELDGAAFHGNKEQRERDLRRDAALAAAGWHIVRFTHARLVADPDGVRREIAAIIAARRALLSR